MEAELIRKGLSEMVLDDVERDGKSSAEVDAKVAKWKSGRDKKKMNEARAEMIAWVSTGQLAHMRDRDPLVIWESLAKVHRARGLATRLALRRKFLTASKAAEETMQAWIGRVKAVAFELEDIGVEVTEEDVILALTMGLDDSYESFIISLDATPTSELNLEHVIYRALNEETRRESRKATTAIADDKTEDENAAMFVKELQRRCFRCGKVGHIKPDCKTPISQIGKNTESIVASTTHTQDIDDEEEIIAF